MFDKFKDECGVFGIFGHAEAANMTYLGLYALQHRGQESAGIAASDGEQVRIFREMGYVADVFNGETLARMKRGAILINTSRGDLIREEALAMALELGHLGAAGLDLYTDEPAIHPRLLAAPRTVLLPHIGSATEETRRKMAAIAVANVQSVLNCKPPLTPVF